MATNDLDDYEPALGDAPTDDGGAADDGEDNQPGVGLDGGSVGFTQHRQLSDATKARLKAIADEGRKARARGEDPLLAMVPALSIDGAPPSVGGEPDPAEPGGEPAPDPAVPAAAPAVAPAAEAIAAWERANAAQLAADERHRAADAREKKLAELDDAREKKLAELDELPERALEDPVGVMKWLVAKALGDGASDADKASTFSDLLTEMSIHGLDVELPDTIKLKHETSKLKRSISKHNRELARTKAQAAEQALATEQQAKIDGVVKKIDAELAAAADEAGKPRTPMLKRFPFLANVEGGAGRLIFDVVKKQVDRDGTLLSIEQAATIANEHLKKESAAYIARWQALHQPASPAAAPAPPSNQSTDRSSVTRSPQLSQRAASEAIPVRDRDPQEERPFNMEEHRRNSMKKLRPAFAEKK